MFKYHNLKRFLDALVAVIAIVLTAPIMALTIFMLVLSGESSPILAQWRVGRSGHLFLFYKFRTMKRLKGDDKGSSLTLANDARITFLGRLLRASKIDEFPQFFNVLNGDISFVGPRPLMPEIFKIYSKEDQQIIASVKPGITGLGSVVFRDEQSILKNASKPSEVVYKEQIAPAKAYLETWYVENQSFMVDFKILVLTVWSVLYSRTRLVYRLFKNIPRYQL